MAEIIFQNKEDASQFHVLLEKQLQSRFSVKNLIFLKDNGNHTYVKIDKNMSVLMEASKKAFLDFITKIKLNEWFKKILKEHYYFEDEEEQEQIIDIIRSILEGNRKDLELFVPESHIAQEVEEVVEAIFAEQHHFSFDSFVKFRMRPLLSRLEQYIEISIDEYKMEQEYQIFVQTLRQFLENREAKMGKLHVVIDETVTFYNEQLEEVTRGEIAKLIDRKLLSNHPVYIDSVTIAPLLSIAPKQIFLYASDEEQPLVRTIQNIFEERVVLKRLKDCSFHV